MESILHHFGNVAIDNYDGLYLHGLGLKPKARYKQGFVLKVTNTRFDVYDSAFNFMVSLPVSSHTVFRSISPIPSKGVILILHSDSAGTWAFEIFDIRTGEKAWTFNESTVLNGTGYGFSYDVTKNGDIYILNRATGILKVFDYNGVLKHTVNFFTSTQASNYELRASSGRGVFGLSLYETGHRIYTKDGLLNKVPLMTSSLSMIYLFAVTKKGNLIHSTSVNPGVLRITNVDYINNEIPAYAQLTIGLSGYTVFFLRTIGDKVYLFRQQNSGANRQLVEIDENTHEIQVTALPNNVTVKDIDDKFIYAHDTNKYYVYKRNDLSLVFSYDSTLSTKQIYSTKGRYENFYEYW